MIVIIYSAGQASDYCVAKRPSHRAAAGASVLYGHAFRARTRPIPFQLGGINALGDLSRSCPVRVIINIVLNYFRFPVIHVFYYDPRLYFVRVAFLLLDPTVRFSRVSKIFFFLRAFRTRSVHGRRQFFYFRRSSILTIDENRENVRRR